MKLRSFLAWLVALVAFCFGSQPAFAGLLGPQTRRDAENLFEVEIKVYSVPTLHELIPSVETPPPYQVPNRLFPGRVDTIDFSSNKYVFGSIRYKRPEDVWTLTSVTFKCTSNDPELATRLDKVTIVGVVAHKTYFLLPVNGLAPVPDRDIVLTPTIIRVTGVPPTR